MTGERLNGEASNGFAGSYGDHESGRFVPLLKEAFNLERGEGPTIEACTLFARWRR
jgi:hypothetical protein